MAHLIKAELVVERRDCAERIIAEIRRKLRKLDGLLEIDRTNLRNEGDIVLCLVLCDLKNALFLIGREHEVLARAAADIEPVHLVVVDVVADDLAQSLLVDRAVLVERAEQCGIKSPKISHNNFSFWMK